jgi:hypothetical protein
LRGIFRKIRRLSLKKPAKTNISGEKSDVYEEKGIIRPAAAAIFLSVFYENRLPTDFFWEFY